MKSLHYARTPNLMMNFDFIEASILYDKDIEKDYIIMPESINKLGWNNYHVRLNHNPLRLGHNKHTKELVLNGSLTYFSEGHNFKNDLLKMKDDLCQISDILKTDLFNAKLKELDTGITIPVSHDIKAIIQSHYHVKGMEYSNYKGSIYFYDRERKLRMYDAGKSMKKKLSKSMREYLTLEKGYDPNVNWLRFEVKYYKPMSSFSRIMLLGDIFKDEVISESKQMLMSAYNEIQKDGVIFYPAKKRDCNLATIELIVLNQLGQRLGIRPNEYLKGIIKDIPDQVLNKEDKKNRMRSLNKLCKKLESCSEKSFDLSNDLRNALGLVNS